MTLAGWVIMTASIASVTLACGYCVFRVLSAPNDNSDDAEVEK